jgi:hypothetical protein
MGETYATVDLLPRMAQILAARNAGRAPRVAEGRLRARARGVPMPAEERADAYTKAL